MFFAAVAVLAAQQPPETLYDEAKVPKYLLPDLLVMENGERVRDAKTWTEKRRPEILEMYRTKVFGRAPEKAPRLVFRVDSTDRQALNGRALRKQVTISFADGSDTPKAHMLIYLPAPAKKPAPLFLALSFSPVHAVYADPGVTLRDQWVRDPVTKQMAKQPAAKRSRGASTQQWQLDKILEHGCGLATIYWGRGSSVRDAPYLFATGPCGRTARRADTGQQAPAGRQKTCRMGIASK
jgi:hypothetical protein